MTTSNKKIIDAIDALLPQTQCGLCDYAGCRPYATAIVEDGAAINRCPPGGVATLQQLGKLLQRDVEPYLADMQDKAKPASVVTIREAECIGCTKCIKACPVDAIVGASKLMHTVLTDVCTGCDLCIPPCPVDCIDSVMIPEKNAAAKQAMADQSRERYEKRQQRLLRDKEELTKKHQAAKLTASKADTVAARKAAIQAAVARVKKRHE